MKRIYKYDLLRGENSITKLPVGAKILHVGIKYNSVYAWALVNPNAVLVDTFQVYATGEEVYENEVKSFGGTFILFGGDFVVHVFKLTI